MIENSMPLGIGSLDPYGWRMNRYFAVISFVLLAWNWGCESKAPPGGKPAAAQPPAATASVLPAAVSNASSAVVATSATPTAVQPVVNVGESAPDFALTDLDGKEVKLSSFRGKTVVLEWFNPECPFVKLSHTKGSLVDTAARHSTQGVVWLAINSGAPGKQGHDLQKNREAKESFNLAHPILRDEDGKVGRAYGAQRTPHMYVIDPEGVLIYRGAIDNSPDGEKGAPTGGTLINHVDAALADLAAKRPVAVAETNAYGCSVKYAN